MFPFFAAFMTADSTAQSQGTIWNFICCLTKRRTSLPFFTLPDLTNDSMPPDSPNMPEGKNESASCIRWNSCSLMDVGLPGRQKDLFGYFHLDSGRQEFSKSVYLWLGL